MKDFVATEWFSYAPETIGNYEQIFKKFLFLLPFYNNTVFLLTKVDFCEIVGEDHTT